MNKYLNIRSLVAILVIACLVIGLLAVIRSCIQERIVQACISSTDITLGEIITYEDSTSVAESWLWEFGNGDYDTERVGTYKFPEIGRYQIRLKINNELEKTFHINVRPKNEDNQNEHIIRIEAPSTAVQGEYVLFSAEGNDQNWRWEFGESGIIDSREKTPIHAYRDHGVYFVRLQTDKTQYPIIHRIEILPRYIESDSTDVMTMAGNDIKVKLQNIADGKQFNLNYNHVLKTYLCDNPDIMVTVNNTKRNDFYSYCQGLRLMGRGITVETVFVESSISESNCIDHIIVLQNDTVERVSSDLSSKKEN